MEILNREEKMLAALDNVMRILKRRPSDKQHLGRGTFRILRTVEGNAKLSTRELAEKLGYRPSSLNERLARLENEGYLLREKNPADQRMYLVRLLPKGVELLDELNAERKRMTASIGIILNEDETEELTNLAMKLGEGLNKLSSNNKRDDVL